MNSILVLHPVCSAKESQWTQTLEVIVSTVMELPLQMVLKLHAVSRKEFTNTAALYFNFTFWFIYVFFKNILFEWMLFSSFKTKHLVCDIYLNNLSSYAFWIFDLSLILCFLNIWSIYDVFIVCPAGNFLNPGNNGICEECPVGYWNNMTEHTSCTKCVGAETTENNGTTSENDCRKSPNFSSQNKEYQKLLSQI